MTARLASRGEKLLEQDVEERRGRLQPVSDGWTRLGAAGEG
ncbi:MAG: hypothetical protein NZ523_02695 [Elioraea sp.]|nr:hypothetical protein [Elioraea sp.]